MQKEDGTMNLIQSFFIAFSMYSKIPMPRVSWNEKNMEYAFCFFPWIGCVIGITIWGAGSCLSYLEVTPVFFSVCMTVIPILITGGIHMDGFLDTIDALSSYGEQEKKLAILKDPHAGAFAIIGCGVYLLWSIGIWSEALPQVLPMIACEYALSRTLSGLSMVRFRLAKNTGLAAAFQDGAKRRKVGIVMLVYLVLIVLIMSGIHLFLTLFVVGFAMLCYRYYRTISYKKFGGITGDLAGYFLQICELGMITITIIGAKL